MKKKLTHFDNTGNARMVDVGDKDVTERVAVARATVIMEAATLKLIATKKAKKGDVLAVAQLAGIMAAKKTPDLIPLCHPLALNSVDVKLTLDPKRKRCRHRGDLQVEGPHRRRDGSPDRRLRRRPHRLRHVQIRRPRHGHLRRETRPQVRRQVRHLELIFFRTARVPRAHERAGRARSKREERPLMLTVRDAHARVIAAFEALPSETVSVANATGRVLAVAPAARLTQPPSDLSAMDGYAVRAEDVPAAPTTLKLVGQAPAGGSYDHALMPGETVRIFTGGPLPIGADAIVIQEGHQGRGREDHHPGNAASGPAHPQGRPRLRQWRHAAGRGPHADHARRGAGGGHEPSLALGPSQAARRHPLDRRRARNAGRAGRPQSDRLLLRHRRGGPRARLGRRADAVRHRPRRREADRELHRRRDAARSPDHPGRCLGRRPRSRPGRAEGPGLRHGILADRHAPGQAADVCCQRPRPRARPAIRSRPWSARSCS